MKLGFSQLKNSKEYYIYQEMKHYNDNKLKIFKSESFLACLVNPLLHRYSF